MLPIALNVAKLAVAVVGSGAQAAKRLAALDLAGAGMVVVFAPGAAPELAKAAGGRLIDHLPERQDLERFRILFVGDLAVSVAAPLVHQARALGLLVNVEDVVELCDFHMPAIVRRGDLVFSISTGGRSPALAGMIRQSIDQCFGPEWREHVEQIGKARDEWRRAGLGPAEVSVRSVSLINDAGWLR